MTAQLLSFVTLLVLTAIYALQDNDIPPIYNSSPAIPPRFTNIRKMEQQSFNARPSGTSIKLKCPAAGYPIPAIIWLKDGRPFNSRPSGSAPKLREYTLSMSDLDVDDTGHYTCILYNRHGSVNWTFIVEVQERMPGGPKVLSVTGNQTVFEGDTVRMECNVVSDLTPFVRWLKHYMVNGSFVDSSGAPYAWIVQDSGDPAVKNPNVLLLHAVTPEDGGQYTCLVGTISGASHRSTWLHVLPRGRPGRPQLV